MANICKDFRRALDNILAVTEFNDVFSVDVDGKIVSDREALKVSLLNYLLKQDNYLVQ